MCRMYYTWYLSHHEYGLIFLQNCDLFGAILCVRNNLCAAHLDNYWDINTCTCMHVPRYPAGNVGARLIHLGSDEGSYSVSIILVKKRRRRSTSEADFRAHFQLVSSRILSCDLRFVLKCLCVLRGIPGARLCNRMCCQALYSPGDGHLC